MFFLLKKSSELDFINYLPLGFGEGAEGFGGLFPLPGPDGLGVLLGPFGGDVVTFAMIIFDFKVKK